MDPKFLEPLEKDIKIPEGKIKDEFADAKDSFELSAYALKYLHFIKTRLHNEQQSFALSEKLKIPPINALVSLRLEQFGNGGIRLYFGIYSHDCGYVISTYFDKILIDIGSSLHYEWTRNCDNLETDCLEIVLPNDITLPSPFQVTLYPDFPVTYFNVPENLFPVVKERVATLATITKSISAYASEQGLIHDDILECKGLLNFGIGINELPINQVVFQIKSMLIPLQPLNINGVLSEERLVYNYNLTLPDFSPIPKYHEDTPIPDLEKEINDFAAQKELTEILAAINRNPIEALEAEICGHSAHCELSDESNDAGPRISVSPTFPARRSSVYYWQQWTADHAARFLEENKQIHARYPSKK